MTKNGMELSCLIVCLLAGSRAMRWSAPTHNSMISSMCTPSYKHRGQRSQSGAIPSYKSLTIFTCMNPYTEYVTSFDIIIKYTEFQELTFQASYVGT